MTRFVWCAAACALLLSAVALSGRAHAWTCEQYLWAKSQGITADSAVAKAYFAAHGQPTAADQAKARRCEAGGARKKAGHKPTKRAARVRFVPVPRPAPAREVVLVPEVTAAPAPPEPSEPVVVEPAPQPVPAAAPTPPAEAAPADEPDPPAIKVKTIAITEQPKGDATMLESLLKWAAENPLAALLILALAAFAGRKYLAAFIAWCKRMIGLGESAVAKLRGDVVDAQSKLSELEGKAKSFENDISAIKQKVGL
jgi:hypothetical protein